MKSPSVSDSPAMLRKRCSSGVNGQIQPLNSTRAPQATAGRCSQARPFEEQQPATDHEEDKGQMEQQDQVGADAIPHCR